MNKIKDFHLYFSLAHAWAMVAWVYPGTFPSVMLLGLMCVLWFAAYKEAGK